MTFSLSETKAFFELVLSQSPEDARGALNFELAIIERSEPEFYQGVIEHQRYLPYSSHQWFDFLSKLPLRIFRDEVRIMNRLSPNQREALPPAIFD